MRIEEILDGNLEPRLNLALCQIKATGAKATFSIHVGDAYHSFMHLEVHFNGTKANFTTGNIEEMTKAALRWINDRYTQLTDRRKQLAEELALLERQLCTTTGAQV